MRSFLFLLLGTLVSWAGDFNDVVLQQVESMPAGGGYAVTTSAHEALSSSVKVAPSGLDIRAARAVPSYCSGATYLVFLKTLEGLRPAIPMSSEGCEALLPGKLADGEGVWGRWNANGPGTARLFYELGLGRNFLDWEEAQPGDFMKIFWTDEVGKAERGHSVVFLGMETKDGVESVRFWSSNKPGGYGKKSVPRKRIARAIFSRLEHPERIFLASGLPRRDSYLAGLLTKRSSFAEVGRICGIR